MLKTYRRREPRTIQAVVVTSANAADVARHFHGRIEDEQVKPSDPTDVALWLVLPTLDGPTCRHLITHQGPVVGVHPETGEVIVWSTAAGFFADYEEQTR